MDAFNVTSGGESRRLSDLRGATCYGCTILSHNNLWLNVQFTSTPSSTHFTALGPLTECIKKLGSGSSNGPFLVSYVGGRPW